MTVIAKLQQLQSSIAGFFNHLENVSNDLNSLKDVLDIAKEVTAVIAPGTIAEAVSIADSAVADVQGVVTPQSAE